MIINKDQDTRKGQSFILHWLQYTECANTQLKNNILGKMGNDIYCPRIVEVKCNTTDGRNVWIQVERLIYFLNSFIIEYLLWLNATNLITNVNIDSKFL